ncbi:LysM peptidoglycan-binding domain-containing protein [Weissella soli]|uniref:CAP domain-containing protein n=1 Tax=Weissella soli TaxID=155866 RepID=UPI0021BEF228|nr:CAP domain-containing protein [Weissella soli]MCT8395137.1 LysM peptidoglycan-binding domain-containing protein [Weissella soli]
MARITNKKAIAGVAGALGVVATTQLPGVQAAIEKVADTQNANFAVVSKGTTKTDIKKSSDKDNGVVKASKVVAKAKAAQARVAAAAKTATKTKTATSDKQLHVSSNEDGQLVATVSSENDTSSESAASSDAASLTPAQSAAVASVAASTATPSVDGQTYTVVDGDTFGKLADKFGVAVTDIQAANPNVTATSLQIGQTLIIPTTTAVSAATTVTTTADAASSEATVISDVATVAAVDSSSATATISSAAEIATVASSVVASSEATVASSASSAVASSTASSASSAVASSTASSASSEVASSTASSASSSAASEATTVAGISTAQQATLDALNALRTSMGLGEVTWDASLATRAQARADQIAATGEIPSDHWSWGAGPEVIAIQWGAGEPVINAWYVDDASVGMQGSPLGHRRWLLSPDTTKVGFGINGNIIDGISNGTSF